MKNNFVINEILRRHESHIRMVIHKYFKNKMEADDVFQNVILHIYKKVENLNHETENKFTSKGFIIIFCAADGVVASVTNDCDFMDLFTEISACYTNGITFSAGVGSNLREAYIALLNSKSNGKNQLSHFSELK